MKPLAQPIAYGDGMDAPDCPSGPGCACCGPREYGAATTAAREAEASAASARFAARHVAALDEVCSGRRGCNSTPTETCCGWALCEDCYREHRADDCGELQDDVRRALYPDGCDCTPNASVCYVCAARVDAEVRRRAEAGL